MFQRSAPLIDPKIHKRDVNKFVIRNEIMFFGKLGSKRNLLR